jgi:acyl-CoA synthetase (AMP-forming)/AMP-acid ligase II
MTASWLFERMESWRDEPALVWSDKVSTYGDLLDRMAFWEGELERAGIGAGSVVLEEATFSPNAIGAVLAMIRRRAIAVPVTPLSRVHRDKFGEIAEAQHSLLFDDADGWTLTKHDRPVTNALTQKLLGRDHPGLVIFSSGSTGNHKAVLHDFVALLEKFRRPGIKKSTLTFLLFDHIGGMDTMFNTFANGGTIVIPTSRDPDVVCRTIAAHKVHTLPASPTFLNLLLISDAWRQHDLSSLQLIAYGTESMPAEVLKRLGEAFPDVKLLQTYGLSEMGVLRTRSRDSGSLWIKFSGEGFETKIVDGVLWLRTPSAMMGYLNAPDLFDEEGWLNTQDAVEVDGDYLRILGRVSDLINVGGQKVYPAEVESVLLQMDNVRDVAVFGEKSPLTGQFVAARVNLIEAEPLNDFKKRLRTFCRDKLASYKIPARIEITDRDQFGVRMKKMRSGAATTPSTDGKPEA